jgi:signal transduction histidine kinase
VLQNLLLNAVKFTEADTRPQVSVTASREESGWRIEVRDNGIGVPASDRDRIFALFGRVDSRYAGTGIGLAVCHRIIDHHGGRIWVSDAPGGGSVFSFTLPERQPDPEPTPTAWVFRSSAVAYGPAWTPPRSASIDEDRPQL